jgi:glycosyltransferase involved in cell wall biosynthesis
MNLAINSRFLTQPITGVQRYAIEISLQIRERYPSATFLCPQGILQHEVAAQLDAVKIGKNNGHLWEQIDLPLYLLQRGNPTLLNFCNTAPLLYPNNYITIHDLAFFQHPEWNSRAFAAWYNFLIPKLAKRSKHIYTVSNTMKEEMIVAWHLQRDNIFVTPNGLAREVLSQYAHVAEKEKIILSVGSLSARKNQAALVHGFIESGLAPDYRLVIIGDKNRVFADTALDEATLRKHHVELCSNVNSASLWRWYKKAEIFASTSLYEGFGIPVLEAAHFCCKIVCSDIAVYRELYEGLAIFCDPTDTNSVATALRHAAYAALQRNPNTMLEKYSYSRAADIILQSINNRNAAAQQG